MSDSVADMPGPLPADNPPATVGLFVQRDPQQATPELEDLYPVGTAALIYSATEQEGAAIQVMVQGLARVRLGPAVASTPYFVAEITLLPDPRLDDERAREAATLETLDRQVREHYEVILSRHPAVAEDLRAAAATLDDPLQLAYLVAATSPLTVAERLAILEADGAVAKLRTLLPLLDRLTDVLQVGQEIQDQVQEQVRRTERQFLLREQLKAIQRELGEENPTGNERHRLADRLTAARLPAEAVRAAQHELEHLAGLSPAAPEYGGVRAYLEWLADLPWRTRPAPLIDTATARAVLDRDHYGLAEVKARILEYLAVRKLRQMRQGGDLVGAGAGPEPILCFVGPPGVGKTSLGQSI